MVAERAARDMFPSDFWHTQGLVYLRNVWLFEKCVCHTVNQCTRYITRYMSSLSRECVREGFFGFCGEFYIGTLGNEKDLQIKLGSGYILVIHPLLLEQLFPRF